MPEMVAPFLFFVYVVKWFRTRTVPKMKGDPMVVFSPTRSDELDVDVIFQGVHYKLRVLADENKVDGTCAVCRKLRKVLHATFMEVEEIVNTTTYEVVPEGSELWLRIREFAEKKVKDDATCEECNLHIVTSLAEE
jgi:hypothetical protein